MKPRRHSIQKQENTLSFNLDDTLKQFIPYLLDKASSISEDNYKVKEKIIENAKDLTSKEKLEEINKIGNIRRHERWSDLIYSLVCISIVPTATILIKRNSSIFRNTSH